MWDWLDEVLDWGGKAANYVADNAGSAIAGGLAGMAIGGGGEKNLQNFVLGAGAGLGANYLSDGAIQKGLSSLWNQGAQAVGAGGGAPTNSAWTAATTPSDAPSAVTTFTANSPGSMGTAAGSVLSGDGGVGTATSLSDMEDARRMAAQQGVGLISDARSGGTSISDMTANIGRHQGIGEGVYAAPTSSFGDRLQAGLQTGMTKLGENVVNNLPGTLVKAGISALTGGGGAKRTAGYQQIAAQDQGIADKKNALADQMPLVDAAYNANQAFSRSMNASSKQAEDALDVAQRSGMSGDALAKMQRDYAQYGATNAQTNWHSAYGAALPSQQASYANKAGLYTYAPASVSKAYDVANDQSSADAQGYGALAEDLFGIERKRANADTKTP